MSPTSGKITDILKRTRATQDELRDGVENIRTKIRELHDRREGVVAMAPTREVVVGRIKDLVGSQVDQANVRGCSIKPFLEGPGRYEVPAVMNRHDLLFAFLAPALISAMTAEVDQAYKSVSGISEDERRQQLHKIDRELLGECQEFRVRACG